MNKTDKNYVFLFAHGAGADKDSEWMQQFELLLSQRGVECHRFNFPYMDKRKQDGKRRPPDRMPKLLAHMQAELESLLKRELSAGRDTRIVIGGKSMGGRVASLLADNPQIRPQLSALVCLGFPFHPPKKPEKFRGEHLADIALPSLILQGERDTFGGREEIADYRLSDAVKVEYLSDGDHSFKPRVRSGLTLTTNMQTAADLLVKFLDCI